MSTGNFLKGALMQSIAAWLASELSKLSEDDLCLLDSPLFDFVDFLDKAIKRVYGSNYMSSYSVLVKPLLPTFSESDIPILVDLVINNLPDPHRNVVRRRRLLLETHIKNVLRLLSQGVNGKIGLR